MIKSTSFFAKLSKIALLSLVLSFGGTLGVVAQSDQFETAKTLIAERKYQDAIEYLNGLRLEGSAAAQQYILLADALLQTGAGIASEAAIERARRLGADYSATVVPYSKALLIQRKFGAALGALQGTTIPKTMQQDAFVISGDANFALQQYDDAKRDYELARVLDDSDFQAYLGLARLELRNGTVEAARVLAESAEERASDNTMVQYTMGLISRYLGSLDLAEGHFIESVRLFPGNILANIEMASIRINQSRIAEAEEHLDHVYNSSPNQPMALYLSGVILATRGEYEEAAVLLNRARPITDQYLPAVYVRGMVAYQMKNYIVAREALEKVVVVRPDNKAARLALASTYINQNEPVLAYDLLGPIIEADNVDVHTLTIAATAALRAGDSARSEELYAQAVALKDSGASGAVEGLKTRLALAQYAVGDTEKAVITLSSITAGSAVDIRELGLMGSMQIRNEDYEGAADTIERIIAINPSLALGYNMRGTLEFKLGKFETAIASYTQALDRKSDYFTAHRNRGLAYMNLGQDARAERDLKALLREQPDDVMAKAALAKSLLNQGEAEEAVDYFREAFREIPNSIVLSADYSQALADAGITSRAIEQARSTTRMAADEPEVLKRMGLLLLKLDQARAAERPLSRYAAYNPYSGEAHLLHGRALLKMGLYTGAGISFSRAKNAPDNKQSEAILDWYFFAAEALGQKYRIALKRLELLDFSNRPVDVSASIVGDLLLASGEPVEAERLYRQVLLTESSGPVIVGLANALTAQDRIEEAIIELQAYVSDVPDDRLAREVLGQRMENLGRYEDAGKQYEAILRIGIADPRIAAHLASVYLKLGDTTSIRLAERAYLLMPEDPYVLNVHGWVMLQAGRNTEKAIKSLAKAVRRSPSNAEYKYHLAMAHLARGKKSEARRILQQALNLSDTFEGAAEAKRQLTLLQF